LQTRITLVYLNIKLDHFGLINKRGTWRIKNIIQRNTH